jgi:hypothetical protein
MSEHTSHAMAQVRVVDPELFAELAGNAPFVLVSKLSGEEEIVVPEGAEYEFEDFPDEEVSALFSVRASSCYEKCKNNRKYRCCSGVCVRIGDC